MIRYRVRWGGVLMNHHCESNFYCLGSTVVLSGQTAMVVRAGA